MPIWSHAMRPAGAHLHTRTYLARKGAHRPCRGLSCQVKWSRNIGPSEVNGIYDVTRFLKLSGLGSLTAFQQIGRCGGVGGRGVSPAGFCFAFVTLFLVVV
jgi:hypothetical protein